MPLKFLSCLGLVLVALTSTVSAQSTDVAGLFPEPRRVVADFPDDAEQYAAFNLLYSAIQASTRGSASSAAYDKASAYMQYMGAAQTRQEAKGSQTPAFKDFTVRSGQLMRDPQFKRRLIDRYHLPAAAPPATPKPAVGANTGPSAAPPVVRQSPEELMQSDALFWLLTIVAMAFVSNWMAGGDRPFVPSARPATAGDPAQLPDPLRVLQVLDRKYEVELMSGLVVEEKTWAETYTTTRATGGDTYTVGDQMVTNPVQYQTSSSTVQKDRVWLKDLTGHESAWVFSGGVLDSRPGHILSRIGWRASPDRVEFLIAYNHTTGQFATFPAIREANASMRRGPFWAVTLVGTVGFLSAGWNLVPELDPQGSMIWNAMWIGFVGFVGSVVIAVYLDHRSRMKVWNRRNAYFMDHYLPEFRKCLEQLTPTLEQRLK
jgi:hypothetical protein